MKTSVIILNWNGRNLLQRFLPIVLKHTKSRDAEVVVADNGSTDDSVSYVKDNFPYVRLICFDRNYGFAEGYNLAIKEVDAEYVVLLNSDIETTEDWLTSLVGFMDSHPQVAAVQPKIRSYSCRGQFEYAGAAGGFIDRFGYPFCRGRIFGQLEEDRGQYDEPCVVFWATGACLLIRREDYLNVGGLDSRFFAHMEEIDLCWRLNARGRKVMCIPQSVVYHIGGASLDKNNPRKAYLNFRNSLLMLYKNLPDKDFRKIMHIRSLYDDVAYLHFLLTGKFAHAKAVLRARKDYHNMQKQYRDIRAANLQKTIVKDLPGFYPTSLLVQYFFKKKKTFEQLRMNNL